VSPRRNEQQCIESMHWFWLWAFCEVLWVTVSYRCHWGHMNTPAFQMKKLRDLNLGCLVQSDHVIKSKCPLQVTLKSSPILTLHSMEYWQQELVKCQRQLVPCHTTTPHRVTSRLELDGVSHLHSCGSLSLQDRRSWPHSEIEYLKR
jgi:hypothetical protein